MVSMIGAYITIAVFNFTICAIWYLCKEPFTPGVHRGYYIAALFVTAALNGIFWPLTVISIILGWFGIKFCYHKSF